MMTLLVISCQKAGESSDVGRELVLLGMIHSYSLMANDMLVWLAVPPTVCSMAPQLVNLILNAKKEIQIRASDMRLTASAL